MIVSLSANSIQPMLKKTFAFVALSGLLLLTSCGRKHYESNYTIFRYNETGDVTSLDPASARNFENSWIDNQIYNGLIQMDDSFKIKPCIAKSWEVSNDGLQYTFHLRNDVYFQDDSLFQDGKGRKVTASDFVHSFFRLFDARVSDATTLLTDVDRSYPGTYQGFYASNDSTFMIYLKRPYAPFMNILTMKYFSVVPIEAVDKYGQDFGEHPIGTGPFMMKRWEHGVKMILVRNQHYFEKDGAGKQLPYIDGVVVSFLKDVETSFLEFMDGKLDLVSGISAMNPKEVFTPNGQLKKEFQDKMYIQRAPFIKTDYLGFMIDTTRKNVDKNPVHLKAIRQAINYAINREELVHYMRFGVGIPAVNGFIPPFLPCCKNNKVKGYDYDPDKVHQLLAAANYGNNSPDIILRVTSESEAVAQAIQGQLQKAGIKISILKEQPAVLAECVASGQCYFFKKSWVGDYPDGENFLSLFCTKNFSPEGVNYFHYSNPQFDALFEKAIAEGNDSIRYADYCKLDEMVINDAPVVPLYYDEVIHLVNKRVSGLSVNSLNTLDLRYVTKPEDSQGH
jgi:peptide/nickel transport system substrate-binding protein